MWLLQEIYIIVLFGHSIVAALKLPESLRQKLPQWLGGAPWYGKPAPYLPEGLEGRGESGGLAFTCTGCSKCCRMDGDVWLAPEESVAICQFLNVDEETFRILYVRNESISRLNDNEKWLCLVRGGGTQEGQGVPEETGNTPDSSEGDPPSSSSAGCVFLDPFGKCSIYPVRPIQCRTYPFWPSLLEDRETWESEAVLPDHELSGDQYLSRRPHRYWSLEEGGCEGINHKDSELVPEEEISAKKRAALRHWERFPDDDIKETTWYL